MVVGAGGAVPGESRSVLAPLDRIPATVRRGDSTRIDVVVRTRGVGHFFPSGTVDAFDCWLELKAEDETGRVIFWSGMADEESPVEPGAHFYRSLLIDAHGNPIDKRNASAARAVVYVRLIPPGAADTVHFRLEVPEWTGEEITLTARLNYRKFSWFNTHWAYAGEPDPGQQGATFTRDFDGWLDIFVANGDLDLVVTTNGGMAAIFENRGQSGNWLQIDLEGRISNRDGLGAVVAVEIAGEVQTTLVRTGSSYLSQSQVMPTFGLGSATTIDRVSVIWPSGERSERVNVRVNQRLKIVEGS